MDIPEHGPLHRITFLRHGESVGNAERRFQGQADFPLTRTGVRQAHELARRWKAEGVSFDRAFSSPLRRARQTAEIVSKTLGVPLEFDPDWAEIDNGLLAGLTHEAGTQVAPRPPFMTPYTRYGRTGESRWELYIRVGRCIQRLIDLPAARYLVVAHGGILNMAMYAVLNIAPQADFSGPGFLFENMTFATLAYDASHHNWQFVAFDNRSHPGT